jgi:hypothetical protein
MPMETIQANRLEPMRSSAWRAPYVVEGYCGALASGIFEPHPL